MADFNVPLNRLMFGHEDGAGINARVAGRQDGIAELAANLNARGQIENLVVKRVAGEAGEIYSVSNGNRRLAAFHMIYGPDSPQPIRCTLREVDEDGAFEDSLTTAVTAKQLHPVDQYEAFARLEEHGKTHEEIAHQYGMSEKEVRQALALGRLSPKIRQAWRAGEIKAEIAKAFTLAIDDKTQDKIFDKLKKDNQLWESYVKKELGADIDEDVTELLNVVGAQAYRDRGGSVTEDLFGNSHIISDEPLLKLMAQEQLGARCEQLKADGWAWAELESNLPHGARFWPKSELKEWIYEGDEEARLEKANAALQVIDDDENLSYNEAETAREKLEREIADIETAARARSYDAKQKKKLGCIVDIEDGRVVVLYGVKKPTEVKLFGGESADDDGEELPAGVKKRAAAAEPEEPEISNALLQRLSIQLTTAAATALILDEQLALAVLLAGFGCYSVSGVKASISGLGARGERGLLGSEDMSKALALATQLKPAERISLLAQAAANALDFQGRSMDTDDRHSGPLAIVNTIDAKAFNAAMRGAFDAKDYFAGVNKALCLKAIEEAMGADMARQQSKNGKIEIVAFATENVPATGWLPPQLRAKGYDGPPMKMKGKVVAANKPKAEGKAAKPAAKKAVKKTAKKPAPKKAAPKKKKR